MSDTKFAKGPYSLMLGMPTNVLGPDGCRLARCDFDGDFDHPEAHANAKLFSAAPELYAALERFMQIAWETHRTDPAYDLGRAALAKARGETP